MAKTVSIDWAGEWRFDGYDSKDMPVDIDGKQQLGSKPSDLLPMALAACSGTDLVMLMDADETVTLTSLSVTASYTQQPDPPWAFKRIRLHYDLRGEGLTDALVAEAVRRSEDELCSVAASIRPTVEIESTWEIVPG